MKLISLPHTVVGLILSSLSSPTILSYLVNFWEDSNYSRIRLSKDNIGKYLDDLLRIFICTLAESNGNTINECLSVFTRRGYF